MPDDRTVVRPKKSAQGEKLRERAPCVVVVEGNNLGMTFHLSKRSMSVGRSDQNDIYLHEDGVSRQHARIDVGEGTYKISDLKSTNGTFVNDEPIKQAVTLKDGDKIRLGEVVLRFSYQDQQDVDYQEKLRGMAMRDGLTKVFNRRYFMEAFQREMSFALRLRQPLSCLMFDIDHFKKINDTYGHAAGDTVLKALAERLSREIRGYDVLARYGGEEFVVLLRGTVADNAVLFAERIRKVVEALDVEFEGTLLKITISIGVAALDPDHALMADDLVKQADGFLYEAKKTGRNRVCSAGNRTA
ncbi:MAG: GGDEF domain-containing protein [Pseudomonadota bacterium]